MRLIDADALRESIKDSYAESKMVRDEMECEFRDFAEGKMIALLEVIMKIDKAPTVDACYNADV